MKDRVFQGRAQLVLCAGDLSDGSRRRIGFVCETQDIPCCGIAETQAALAPICKRPTGVFAVTDPELAKLCKKNLPAQGAAADPIRTAKAPADHKEERPCQ